MPILPEAGVTPEQIATTAALTAAGQSRRDVAGRLGVGKSSVQRATQSAREIIEAIRDDLIHTTAKTAADNIRHAIKAYKDKASDTQLREHGFKASNRMLETIGIYPAHAPSVLVQQIIQGNAVQITPELAQSIRDGWGDAGRQVIDVDRPVDNPSYQPDPQTTDGQSVVIST
jgi:hypothetical protein